MAVVDVRGVPSHHEIDGAGPPVVLLHGGFCSLENLRPVGERLTPSYAVHAVERPGHGRTPDRPGPFGYAEGVLDTLAYLDAVGLDSAHLVGFSDGAILALMLAMEHPGRVRSVVAISANLSPDAFASGQTQDEAADGEDPAHARLHADYERLSPDGPAHAEVVLAKLTELWTTQPQILVADLDRITAPTLVMAADRDVIAHEHTLAIARGVRGARLAIVPGTSHMLVAERPALVAALVRSHLDDVAR